ncbi:hypothetical protein Pmani_038582 [Petrolisthes manimaculis]|uniref:Uncharacterized protein n=1 Tax=Petrolisthes manimaculis TaxID=1843537 RepID=A0AAE1NFV8_9EUCA|nr:hypothetical protein Pmani_038582 [Petrolisthes manimaculis]
MDSLLPPAWLSGDQQLVVSRCHPPGPLSHQVAGTEGRRDNATPNFPSKISATRVDRERPPMVTLGLWCSLDVYIPVVTPPPAPHAAAAPHPPTSSPPDAAPALVPCASASSDFNSPNPFTSYQTNVILLFLLTLFDPLFPLTLLPLNYA